MRAARLPLMSAMHGTCGQGATDPDIITLFNGWARLSTDPHGEMRGRPLEGFFQAGTRLVAHYRLRANGSPLIRTYSIQSSSNEWCGVFLIQGTLDQGKPPEGQVPKGSAEVSVLRCIEDSWSEAIRVRSYSYVPQTVELEMELGCPIADVEFDEEMKTEFASKIVHVEPRIFLNGELPGLHYERDFGPRTHAPRKELES